MTNLMLITLFGGMALLLYGMQLVGEGLQLAASGRMRQILGTITNNRFKGMVVGAFITAVIQSSSATTVMLVGFASSGLMDLTQTMGVILGADIGTTVTVQLIAFQLFDYALLLVGIGSPDLRVQAEDLQICGPGDPGLRLHLLCDEGHVGCDGAVAAERAGEGAARLSG